MKDIIFPAKNSVKKRKRRGRGNSSGLGGECGRGHKGQKSRTGYSARSGFEGGQMPLYRRLPKKRGHGNSPVSHYSIINVGVIERFFDEGSVVDLDTLIQKRMVKKTTVLRVLGGGEITKKMTIKAHHFSKQALLKLEKIGVCVEIIS